jgi:hypothetical protein
MDWASAYAFSVAALVAAKRLADSELTPGDAVKHQQQDGGQDGKPILHYITIDQLNGETARLLALDHGLELIIAEPGERPRLERQRAAVVVDWDCLPNEARSELLNSARLRIVAVHGYTVSESLKSHFARCQIAYDRQLDARLFGDLAFTDTVA